MQSTDVHRTRTGEAEADFFFFSRRSVFTVLVEYTQLHSSAMNERQRAYSYTVNIAHRVLYEKTQWAKTKSLKHTRSSSQFSKLKPITGVTAVCAETTCARFCAAQGPPSSMVHPIDLE